MESVSTEEYDPTEAVEGVHLAILAGGENMNVQHFEIEPGAVVPAHSHPHEQAGYLTNGTLTFILDDEERELEAGDSYSIPGEEHHGVENRGEEVVRGVDIFSPPRENPDWAE
jgi:quercetin dioxygenase-like cupin family protein